MESNTPDFLMEDTEEGVDKSGLERLQSLVDNYKHFDDEVEKAEASLKILKSHFNKIANEEIPNLLAQYGLSEIKLASGAKVIVKEDANVSIKNESRFFLWLKNREEDDIIKLQYDFSNKLEDEMRMAIDDFLIERDVEYETNMGVHGQTKKKYFKELLGIGKADQKEGIASGKYMKMQDLPEWASVFVIKKTKLK